MSTAASQVPSRLAVVLCALLAAGAGVAQEYSEELPSAHCGASQSVSDALRRLNALRARGAPCDGATPSQTSAAPLQWNSTLESVAARQANEMVALNDMGHRDRQNRGLPVRLSALGYQFALAAENVAVGYASVDAVVDAWLASEAHCANLMSTSMREFGLACSDGARGDGADRYWSLVLGAPSTIR